MAQVLWLMLEEHKAARTERQANLATLQHLAQICHQQQPQWWQWQ
jgi:hypothetical protein